MKKVLSLVLVLAMVLGAFSFVSAAAPDVAGTVYEDAVTRLALLKILEGYPDGTFKPEAQITRAEFAAVAVRAKGLDATAKAAQGLATGFADVPATHWASGYVGTAARLGIVNGVGNGQFAPAAPVKYEEAITMLVRALGYEAAAKAKGGYPYGYLIVANETGLLDAVKGVQGTPALRGIVAQLTDNALEIPMMVQVGFGSEVKWVVSGTKEHGGDEKYLLDDMGFDTYEGRVVSVNTKKNEITLDNEDEDLKLKDKVVKVGTGFDFYEVEGLTIKAWYSNDTVILYTVKDEAKFDAVAYDADEKELTLVTEDENYEVAKGAYLELDGKKVAAKDFAADYAKIVLNDDDEIFWAQGYTLAAGDMIVVEEVKGDVIEGYDNEELKVKDFTIVKDGKTVDAEDLEDGEVVLYNNGEKFAVVATATKAGKIDRVYSTEYRFDGKTYKTADAKYFDGKNLTDLDDIVKELADDEDELDAIYNFHNKVILLAGDSKDADASSFYAVLLEDAYYYKNRNKVYLSINVRNADGAKKSYDLGYAVFKDSKLLTDSKVTTEAVFNALTDKAGILGTLSLKGTQKLGAENNVVKITVDKDGDVTKVAVPEQDKVADDFKVTATYADGVNGDYRLSSSTVVFYDSNKKAIKVGDVKDEFGLIKEADGLIYFEAGKAVAVVAKTDVDEKTKTVVGLLTAVKALKDDKGYEFRIKVAGTNETYVTESSFKDASLNGIVVGDKNIIVKLTVGEKSGYVIKAEKHTNTVSGKASAASGKTITVVESAYDGEYGLVDNFKIYDANDDYAEIKNVRDLKDKAVTLYLDGGSKYYAAYVIAGVKTPEVEDELKVDSINKADKFIIIGGTLYKYATDDVVKDLVGGEVVTSITTQVLNGSTYVTKIVVKAE